MSPKMADMARRVEWVTSPALKEQAADQCAVLSRSQLVEHGLSYGNIRDELAAGRWSPCGRAAIVLQSGPLSLAQRRWVAVLNAGTTATLGGLTAAEDHGLIGFETPTVHLLIEHGHWVYPRKVSRCMCRAGSRWLTAFRRAGSRSYGSSAA